MSVEKFSVSFDPDLGRRIRQAAEADDETVSAFLAEAARERLRQLALDRWLDDAAAEHGVTRDELLELGESILAESTTASTAARRRAGRRAAAP